MAESPLRILAISRRTSVVSRLKVELEKINIQLMFSRITKVESLKNIVQKESVSLVFLDETVENIEREFCGAAKLELECPAMILLVDEETLDAKAKAVRLGCLSTLKVDDIESAAASGLIEEVIRSGREREEERSQKKLQLKIFTLLGEGAGIVDAEGRVVLGNPAIARLVGRSREKLVGVSLAEMIDLPSQKNVLRALIQQKRGEASTYDVHLRKPKGRVLRINATPMLDKQGRFTGSVVIGTDITEQKRLEDSLLERQQLYVTLVKSIPQSAILMYDKQLRFTLAEGPLLKDLGYVPGEMLGKTVQETMRESSYRSVGPQYMAALKGTSLSQRHYLNGRSYLIKTSPTFGPNGEINGGLVMTVDVSAQTRAEEMLVTQFELGQVITRAKESKEVFETWISASLVVGGVQGGMVYQRDPVGKRYQLVESSGLNAAQIRRLRYLEPRHPLVLQAGKGRPQFTLAGKVADSLKDDLGPRGGYRPAGVLPVVQNGAVTAFIVLLSNSTIKINGDSYRTLESMTDMVGQYLSRLEESEQRKRLTEYLRGIVDSQEDMVIRLNLNGQLGFINDAFAEKFGYSREQLLKSPYQPEVHPEDCGLWEKALKKLEKPPHRARVELRMNTLEGWRWIAWEHAGIMGEKGGLREVQAVGHDITENRLAQEELKKNEQELNLFFRQSMDGFFFMMLDRSVEWNDKVKKENVLDYVFDHQRITRINNAMLDQYGAKREDFLGLTPREFFEHDIEGGRQIWRKFFDEGRLHIETDERRFDGSQMWVEGDYICLYDKEERIIGHFGVQRDVTDRYEAESALRESEERLELVVDAAELGIWDIDLKTGNTHRNDRWAEMLGYEPNEIEETRDAWEAIIHPDDLAASNKAIRDHLQGKTETARVVHRLRTKEGGWKWILNWGRVVERDEKGKPTRAAGTHIDIDDQVRVEEKLRESEQLLEEAQRIAKLGYWEWDLTNENLVWSDEMIRIYGHKPGAFKPSIAGMENQIHPEDLERVKKAHQLFLRNPKKSFEVEHRVILPNEKVRYLQSQGRLISDKKQRSRRIVGTVQDITERKLAEESLRQSEERFRTVWNSVVDGLVTIREDGSIESVNPAAAKLFGYTQKQLVGKNVKILMPEPISNQHDEFLARYKETGEAKIIGKGREVVGRHASGKMFPIDLAVNEVVIGDTRFFSGILRDITERKRITEQLQDSEERYRMLAEYSADLISKHDLQGIYTFASPASLSLLGYEPEELLGKNAYDFFHPDDLQKLGLSHERLMATPDIITIDYRVRREDGSYIWFETMSRTIRDPQGAPQEIIAMSRDVSQRKEAEEKLQQASEELLQAYEETARAQKEAERANEAKSQFLASMSHEIRTPMTAILGFSKILRGRVSDGKSREFVDNMVSSGEHLLDLINDVLDISRVEAGRMVLNPQPVDLKQLADDIVNLFRPLSEDKGLTLTSDIRDLPPRLNLDRQRIRQIITNLLGNAIKFTEEGSVSLSVHPDKKRKGIVIEVCDSGPGVPEEAKERIFDPFYQSENTRYTKTQGTGLGLSITSKLIQAMEGTIALSTKLGHGSTFTAFIPCKAVKLDDVLPEDIRQLEIKTAEPLERLAILVADDHAPNRLLIDHILSTRGHRVTVVENGQEAVNAFSKSAFDVVLLDVQMPVMGGYEAIRHIRKTPGGDRVPVITLTAFAMRGDRLKSLEAGADDYIAKPFDPDDLISKVENIRTQLGREGESAGSSVAVEKTSSDEINDDPMIELKKTYLAEVLREAKEFAEAAPDVDKIKMWGHRIAGSGGSFGYPELTTLGRSIEHSEELDHSGRTKMLQDILELAQKELDAF